MMNIVILAGGAGSRLWPMSTEAQPKQFQKLVSEKTMLQETYERIAFAGIEHIYVSTNEEYVHLVREQLPQVPADHIIAEPILRDTAPCIGLAAATIAKKDPDAVMAVVYADHLVQDAKEFEQKLKVAVNLAAEQGTFNIIEVKAKYPNVNLGYVKIGAKLEDRDDVEIYAFEAFKEKPDYETAKRFVASYSYLWNTGYYVWRVSSILEAFAQHLPQTHAQLMAIQNGGSIQEHYPLCDKISIDYGIMEKLDPSKVRIIPADLGWSDIGTWDSLHEELAENPEANVEKGSVLELDCSGSLLYNVGTRDLAVFGLHDMVVVQTDEVTLICPKNKSAHLKNLLNAKPKTESDHS